MDAAGVERAIITIDAQRPGALRRDRPQASPASSCPPRWSIPLQGMEALRLIDRLASKHGLGLVRIVPFLVNRPPNDKVYYPGVREVHRARPADLGQHRHPGAADARRAAAAALPRRGLPLLPRADADHGARRRPVVGRGDPPPAQVPEPLHDDVGVRAEVSARRADPVHEHARARRRSSSPPITRCCRSSAASREAEALPFREGVLEQYLRENALRVFRWPDLRGVICTSPVGIVARSISMRSREVEATSRARAWLALALVPGLGPGTGAPPRRARRRPGGGPRPVARRAGGGGTRAPWAWLEAGVRAEHELAQPRRARCLAVRMGRGGLSGRRCAPSPTRRSCSPSAGRSPADEPAPWPSSARGARAATAAASRRSWRAAWPPVGITVVSGLADRDRRGRPSRRARRRRADGRGPRDRASTASIRPGMPGCRAPSGRQRRAGDGVPLRHAAAARTTFRAAIA